MSNRLYPVPRRISMPSSMPADLNGAYRASTALASAVVGIQLAAADSEYYAGDDFYSPVDAGCASRVDRLGHKGTRCFGSSENGVALRRNR